MIIYLSLRQLLLNQIAVLVRKQADKSNDDPERLLRRLNYLQQALEQIKSFQHNTNYQYVIKHFNVDPTDTEQRQIRELSRLFDNIGDAGKREKSGFTTQRSETLFTGAAEEQYPKFYGSDNEMEDQKVSSHDKKAPRWITFRGFAHWLRKQSFIKFKRRNDQEKYKKIWNTVLGLKLVDQWEKGRIKPDNIIGRYGTSQPYIAIHKCGTKEIVKASLLRLSITQNRIFKFNIDASEVNARTYNAANSHSRARRSIDMDNDEESQQYNNGLQLNANQLIQGRNLFDEVQNKDVLRIVATMLWDKDLANSVLEELLHNPRFSMYGIHAKNIADTIAREMNLQPASSYDTEQTPLDEQQVQQPQTQQKNASAVEQFSLPSKPKPKPQPPQRANYGQDRNKGGNVYNAQYGQPRNENPAGNFSFQQANRNNNNNAAATNDNAQYYPQKKQSDNYKHNEPQSVPEHYTPSPSPNVMSPEITGTAKPHHRPQSASVVMHDNIRDSEIHDYGAHNEYDSEEHNEYHDGDDEDESVSNSAEFPQQERSNDNIGFGSNHPSMAHNFSSESQQSQKSNQSDQSFIMNNNNEFSHDTHPSTLLNMFDNSSEFNAVKEKQSHRDSMPFIPEVTEIEENSKQIVNEQSKTDNAANTTHNETKPHPQTTTEETDPQNTAQNESKAGLRRKKSVAQRTSFLKKDFINLKETQRWNKVNARLNAVFDPSVSATLKEFAIEEEFDFQAILDDIEEYPDDPDDSTIIEYMQNSFSWDKKECDKFYRTIKRILMDRKLSRRSDSLARLLSFDVTEATRSYKNIPAVEDEKMDLNNFRTKWSSAFMQQLQKYCIQEEYDLEAIAEDLESFEEESSMIAEEMAKQNGWDQQKVNAFVNDLRRFINIDPEEAKKHLSVAD